MEMKLNGISSIPQGSGNEKSVNNPKSSMGEDAFLKILVAQLKHQDPMEPVKDREFIAQMAQFSSLEQMSNLNKTMKKFVEGEMKHSLLNKSDLISKEVHWNESVNGQAGSGIVSAVLMREGHLLAEIKGENNSLIPVEAIERVEKGGL
jgi:flagellar basal-body rod modification protein FlgD